MSRNVLGQILKICFYCVIGQKVTIAVPVGTHTMQFKLNNELIAKKVHIKIVIKLQTKSESSSDDLMLSCALCHEKMR